MMEQEMETSTGATAERMSRGGDRSSPLGPSSRASYCVTIVGATPAESECLEDHLRRAKDSLAFAIRHESSVAGSSFPAETVHAVVLTPASLAEATSADADAVRSATRPGTCRIFLCVCPGQSLPPDAGLLDDFIQRTPSNSAEAIAQQIVGFFREADHLNRRSTLRAFRDLACFGAYRLLKVLWSVSYVFAAFHVLNAAAILAGHELWSGVAGIPNAVPLATFFGVFFIVHCVVLVARNALFGGRIVRHLGAGFAMYAGAFVLAAAATATSISVVGPSSRLVLASTALAVGVYAFYMYARRIRAECSSLSQLQATMADAQRRSEILTMIGTHPLSSAAFPFCSFRPSPLFISYMHRSAWSSSTADAIHQWTSARGFEVFLDRSTIPSGSLWRQFLLRAISECGCFIAVLDGDADATDWVLAESAYAALLRKSIGKPRILLVIRHVDAIATREHNPFRTIYLDVFQCPEQLRHGAVILPVDHEELTAERVLTAMSGMRPMGLLR